VTCYRKDLPYWKTHTYMIKTSPLPHLPYINKVDKKRAILDTEKPQFSVQPSVCSSKTVFCPRYLHKSRDITSVIETRV
jgi:hypothetical protein